MKICEYENIKCPYCGEGEEEKLVNSGPHPFTHRVGNGDNLHLVEGPGHFIRCKSCSGEFIITCED